VASIAISLLFTTCFRSFRLITLYRMLLAYSRYRKCYIRIQNVLHCVVHYTYSKGL